MSTPRPYVDLDPIAAIVAERGYQDAKWGDVNHDVHMLSEWALILGSEYGEALDAIKDVRWGPSDFGAVDANLLNVRSELVQVAAVAVAIIEQIDAARESYKP